MEAQKFPKLIQWLNLRLILVLVERLFGGKEVDIRPQGNVDITFGGDYQKIDNPEWPRRQQVSGGFDFDMGIRINIEGKVGEKLNLSTNYNNKATFDFDNIIKIQYDALKFNEDEILRNMSEAGNVSLPLRSELIQGSQSLLGIKAELQFGYLRLTALASQQKSERKDIEIQGGTQLQEFEVRADEYDENRHFFVSHYNRAVFESSLTNMPQVNK